MSNFPFSFMKENYVSSKTNQPSDFVTEHWNVFGDDFIKLFDNTEKWSRMLRNAITLGLNDNLVKISNKRFSTEGNDYWHELRSKNLKDLMDDPINNEEEIKKLTSFFHETATLTSYDYLIDNRSSQLAAFKEFVDFIPNDITLENFLINDVFEINIAGKSGSQSSLLTFYSFLVSLLLFLIISLKLFTISRDSNSLKDILINAILSSSLLFSSFIIS